MTEEQKTVAIYGLACPITGKIRYVGKSQDPKARFRQHLYTAKSKKYHQNTHTYRWLRELYQQDLEPELVIIERVTEDTWIERERYWIAHYGLDNLCNINAGGLQPVARIIGGSKMVRMNYHLTERQVRLLRMYAAQTGLSVAEVIRRCVDEWLKETEQLILMLAPHCTKKE